MQNCLLTLWNSSSLMGEKQKNHQFDQAAPQKVTHKARLGSATNCDLDQAIPSLLGLSFPFCKVKGLSKQYQIFSGSLSMLLSTKWAWELLNDLSPFILSLKLPCLFCF